MYLIAATLRKASCRCCTEPDNIHMRGCTRCIRSLTRKAPQNPKHPEEDVCGPVHETVHVDELLVGNVFMGYVHTLSLAS